MPHASLRSGSSSGVFAIAIASFSLGLAAQQRSWQRLPHVGGDGQPTMAYDSARQRAVLIVGDDTFEWQGGRWAHRVQTPGLTPLQGSQVYDAQNAVCLLFGGRSGTYSDELWQYDGRGWQLLTPTLRPAARATSAGFDRARARTVVFGGLSSLGWFDDTWEWDGTVWTQPAPSVRPAARIEHRMAYDPVGQRSLLFGGVGPGGAFGDTWSWDGSAWVQLAPATAPSARLGHALATDLARGRVVLFGGMVGGVTDTYFDDTWEWDGTSWSLRTPVAHPERRNYAAMAYDESSSRCLLFGGYNPQQLLTDTWSWDGAQWRLESAGRPGGGGGAGGVVADHSRREVLMLVADPAGLLGETWVGNGVDWTRRTTTTAPAARSAPMAGDDARGEVVLFGGFGATPLADTWVWNGSDWTRRLPASSPSPGHHPMTYDSARQVVVLCEQGSVDVWEWNGAAWSLRPTTTPPSQRWLFSIAYDDARQRLVLFGGYHGVCGGTCTVTANYDQTWLWDGTAWTQAPTPQPPQGRVGAAMVYDPDRQRVVLAGGARRTAIGHHYMDWPLLDCWEWDGSGWTSLPPLTRRPGQGVFDPVLRRVVLLDIRPWTLTAEPRASTPYGAGCPGTHGVPWLSSNGPHLGNTSFALDLGAAPANATSFLGFAFTAGNQPIGSRCALLIGPTFSIVPTVANAAGFASLAIPIPAAPALRGLVVHAQALVLDGGVAGGFSMSNGLLLRVGD